MSDNLTADEEKTLEQVTTYIARELSEGKSKEQIVKDLITKGWPRDDALKFVEPTELLLKEYKKSPEGRQTLVTAAKRHIIYGLLWLAGGMTVTYLTYATAGTDITYVLAIGAYLWGLIEFIRGLADWLKYKN
ncbi:MAG: hypothetical protein WC370_00985 [Dehalococcoidales bacterium]|jgi:hypothetical protein